MYHTKGVAMNSLKSLFSGATSNDLEANDRKSFFTPTNTKIFNAFNLPYSDNVFKTFTDENIKIWKRLENGEITKAYLRYFGIKKEHYNDSQKIGEGLFQQIRDYTVDMVATDCETCKWQIEMSMGLEVLNPISILAEALDFEKTRELNMNKE